jgi:hypothetical protein
MPDILHTVNAVKYFRILWLLPLSRVSASDHREDKPSLPTGKKRLVAFD